MARRGAAAEREWGANSPAAAERREEVLAAGCAAWEQGFRSCWRGRLVGVLCCEDECAARVLCIPGRAGHRETWPAGCCRHRTEIRIRSPRLGTSGTVGEGRLGNSAKWTQNFGRRVASGSCAERGGLGAVLRQCAGAVPRGA